MLYCFLTDIHVKKVDLLAENRGEYQIANTIKIENIRNNV